MTDSEILSNRVSEFYRQLSGVCRGCGRDPESVQVLFATKYLGPEECPLFVERMVADTRGIVLIGENRVQSAKEKFPLLKESLREDHQRVKKICIGTLQKNKASLAVQLFDEIHSVDSLDLAILLDRQLEKMGKRMPIFLQVNVSGEVRKHGISLQEIDHITSNVPKLTHVELRGLMTMAPLVENPEEVRPVFKTLRQLADRYHLQASMGMSHDWTVAVEEGSDIVRIGSQIFRP